MLNWFVAVICSVTVWAAPAVCLAQTPAGQTGSLRVRITSETGPVPGAAIVAGAQKASTGPDGSARLTLPPGEVRVSVEA